MTFEDAASYFSSRLNEGEISKSTGLAAIETLMRCIENSEATTVNELMDELKKVIAAMSSTDYSSTSVRSASELFLRFISLATAEQNVQKFSDLIDMYKDRGIFFINRIAKSRALIASYARPFIENNMNILTHSYSNVVLTALFNAKREGANIHVYVTESQPDASGKKMLKRLKKEGIRCTLILDAAVGYIMESIDMVLIGAEGVMETGGVINKIGTLSIATCASAMNKKVYVMAESIKFVKEYPLNQGDIPAEFKVFTSDDSDFTEEHPRVDYTPPQYINLLFTDLGILTPAAVGDELIKLYT
ncbi:unnamed protein product [Enterobius vermicularis]|uniref:Translation initiation factor eIF2B subunit alpha n=1 Tax=Enterobius vermicularis TaxID=51028 RepID=A0A0N4VHA1_ENTVE|nr:unnamed protein product [Enterobius vermicularis]